MSSAEENSRNVNVLGRAGAAVALSVGALVFSAAPAFAGETAPTPSTTECGSYGDPCLQPQPAETNTAATRPPELPTVTSPTTPAEAANSSTLAFTGTDVAGMSIAGGTLIGAGLGMVLTSRRRKEAGDRA